MGKLTIKKAPFYLSASNDYEAEMILTGNMNEMLVEYTGLDQPSQTLISSEMYNLPGARYQGSKANVRNIVLNCYLFNNVTYWRTELYKIFRSGENVNLTYEKEGNVRKISGIVESVTTPQFDAPNKAKQVVQISIMCFEPYLKAPKTTLHKTITAGTIPDSVNDPSWFKSNVIVGINDQSIYYFEFRGSQAYVECTLASDIQAIAGNKMMLFFYANNTNGGSFRFQLMNGNDSIYSVVQNVTTSATQYQLQFDLTDDGVQVGARTGMLKLRITASASDMYMSRLTLNNTKKSFTIPYRGDVPTGFKVIAGSSSASNYFDDFELYNASTKEEISISDILIKNVSGGYKELEIDTNALTIKGIAYNTTTETNLIAKWERTNTWIELKQGENKFQITSEIVGSPTLTFEFEELYRGV